LTNVNKLKTFWAVYKLFLDGKTSSNNDQAIMNALISELSKIGFKGLDPL
jgi:hypothetical protein